MKTKRAFLVDKGRFELREVDISPRPDELLVKVASCGLCNWELNHWKGLLGSFPQALGHEWAGVVVDTGREVRDFKPGDIITMFPKDPCQLEGFSEYATIGANTSIAISPTVDIKYAFAEPVKCVVNVLRATAPEAGDNGLVQGCGPMGLWCIQALSGHLLNALIAVDVDETRLSLARKYGATHTINPKTENAAEKLAEITSGHLADFVIEGTGIPSMMNTALTYVRETGRGRLIMMSSHEEVCREFSFKMAMEKSAEIRVAHPSYSTSQAEDLRRAGNLINNGVFNIKDMVTHEFTLDNMEEAFLTLEHKPAGYLKGIVVP